MNIFLLGGDILFRLIRVKGRINLKALLIFILIPVLVGYVSSRLTMNSFEAYQQLQKPNFSPPGWVFGPVWTILYVLMGIASYRIYMYGIKRKDVKSALVVYFIQLFLNFLWSIIFFRLQLRGLAYIEILILAALILLTIDKFYKIDKPAGILMIPYLLWVVFASILNLSVWLLNM